MDKNEMEDKAELIPDFFRELMSRIIPGLVVVFLFIYWSENKHKLALSETSTFTLFLLPAWIIGITLDLGCYYILVTTANIIFRITGYFNKKRFVNNETAF